MSAMNYVSAGAVISADKRYRYRLWREWRGTHDPKNWRWLREEDGSICKDGAGADLGDPKSCVFVMLNPSTADGEQDDPTIRRCVGYAKRWKFERLEVVNLFAFRATYPKSLLTLKNSDDPVGWENQEHVGEVIADAGIIVCAWGAHGRHLQQDETMLGWLGCPPRRIYALGLTSDGQPRHPLYLRNDAPLLPFGWRDK